MNLIENDQFILMFRQIEIGIRESCPAILVFQIQVD